MYTQTTEDLSFSNFDFSSGAPKASGRQIIVEFYWRPVLQDKETLDGGEAVFKNVLYVKKAFLGLGRYQSVDQPAIEADKEMHGDEFRSFKMGNASIPKGTLLSNWTPLPDEFKALLKNNMIQTVEQLASVEDQGLEMINPILTRYKAVAVNWLEKNSGDVVKMREEIESMRQELAAFKNQNQEGNSDSEEDSRPKRGRPRKVESDESFGNSASGIAGMQD